VGVDTGKPSTEWLRQWYGRLGFAEEHAVHTESTPRRRNRDYHYHSSSSYDDEDEEADEILMRKQIVRPTTEA
jgi:hypothetical protein